MAFNLFKFALTVTAIEDLWRWLSYQLPVGLRNKKLTGRLL